MITCKSWQDIWINEGWATYSEAVYFLDLYGWDYYRSYMNTLKYTGGGAYRGPVIYLSSFSKILAPGLRIGFLVADGPVGRHLDGCLAEGDRAQPQ